MSQCIGGIWWISSRNKLCMQTSLCQCIMKLFAKNDQTLATGKTQNSGIPDMLFNSHNTVIMDYIRIRSHDVWQHRCKMDSTAYTNAYQNLQMSALEWCLRLIQALQPSTLLQQQLLMLTLMQLGICTVLRSNTFFIEWLTLW